MTLITLLLLAASAVYAQLDNSSAPFPAATYPDAQSPNLAAQKDSTFSPPYYPSPWGNGDGDWGEAYTKAREFVNKLTILEKVNLTTGVGYVLPSDLPSLFTRLTVSDTGGKAKDASVRTGPSLV